MFRPFNAIHRPTQAKLGESIPTNADLLRRLTNGGGGPSECPRSLWETLVVLTANWGRRRPLVCVVGIEALKYIPVLPTLVKTARLGVTGFCAGSPVPNLPTLSRCKGSRGGIPATLFPHGPPEFVWSDRLIQASGDLIQERSVQPRTGFGTGNDPRTVI